MKPGIQGTVSNELQLPTDEELDCPDLKLTSVPLLAGARHFGRYCYAENNEFALCQFEERNPVKCVKEGKRLTLCALEFFNKVKDHCPNQFEKFWKCVDWKTSQKFLYPCQNEELEFDYCLYKKLGLLKFEPGYLARPHIHESSRPKPSLYRGREYPKDYLKDYPGGPYSPDKKD